MALKPRTFTREFKIAAIKEIQAGKAVGLVARRLGVGKDLLYRWHKEYMKQPTKAFSGQGKAVNVSREAELERKIGQMTLEIDFLKKVLASLEEQQEARNGAGQYSKKSVRKAKG